MLITGLHALPQTARCNHTHHDELQKVIASVADWPAIDRITLARKILETVEESTMPAAGGLRGEEVIKLLQIPQPAPDDDECDRIVAEDRMKHESDQPSIGLILCEYKNKIVAEYALRGMEKSIGVSAYELTRALPKKLQIALPSIEQLEAELSPTRSSKTAATAKKKPTKSPRRRNAE